MKTKQYHIILDEIVESGKINEQLHLDELREKQNYEGTNLEDIIGKWPGDESIEELMKILKK